MTEDPHDAEYLDIFRPKSDSASVDASPGPGAGPGAPTGRGGEVQIAQPIAGEPPPPNERPEDIPTLQTEPLRQHPDPAAGEFDTFITSPDGPGRTLRTVGAVVGGGCLLLMLLAVVLFAFYQVFVREGGEDEVKDTPTPTPTVVAVSMSTPTPVATVEGVVDSPLFVPLVNSDDVRVPLALPERLTVGDAVYTVQAQRAPQGTWPTAPATGDTVAWVYGTVVNYVLGLAPTSENSALVSALQAGDTLSLHMSTGLILDFNVGEVAAGVAGEARHHEQISPRLTLVLLTDDPIYRIVVSAPFFNDEAGEPTLFSEAAVGLVGTLVEQGPVRVTVIEAYQVAAGEAGLPAGTGYLLIDLKIENVGQTVLEPEFFQTFVIDTAGERYPLTMLAEQFAHYGIPIESLAPGETVIGSLGYLVSRSSEGEVRWAFNPLPGSDHWIIVPLSVDFPLAAPTAEPPTVGFARVTVDTDDVFVDQADGLLDIGLRIENISDGAVQVTESNVSLSSWTDGELPLVAPAPPLPWVIEPGELELYQLQFELPTADSALLDVLGHTFSIENLGGE